MSWKILHLDFDYGRGSHLVMRDPKWPIFMRSYFDASLGVEVRLGADTRDTFDDCCVRARVTSNAVTFDAIRFQTYHVRVLHSILGSLDVERQEIDRAVEWANGRLPLPVAAAAWSHPLGNDRLATEPWYEGNVLAFEGPLSKWPRDLTDDGLRDAVLDRANIPRVRRELLIQEARRRGMSKTLADLKAMDLG